MSLLADLPVGAGQVPIYYGHPYGSSWHQGGSVGFPEYVDAPHTPRYAFGHGLSYTTFHYCGLRVCAREATASESLEIGFTLTNTGSCTGTEVAQLYVRDEYASVSRPVLELAGFQRVTIDPGESVAVSFTLSMSQLAFLDADLRWRVEAGNVDILVGAPSDDVRLADVVTITDDALLDGATRAFYAPSRLIRQHRRGPQDHDRPYKRKATAKLKDIARER